MKKNRFAYILLSLLISFSLWLYVVTNVSSEDEATFFNIPVALEGEARLADNNLMITSQSSQTVTLVLSGTRSDLNKVSSSNIIVKANVANIDEPGDRIALEYTISYPGNVPSNAFVEEKRSPGVIYVDVDYRRTKEIPVKIQYTGSRSEDLLYDTENAVLDNSTVLVAGPAAVVDQIQTARVEVDLTDRDESLSEDFRYTLCDAGGKPVDAQNVTTNLEEIHLDLPIRRLREIQLKLDVIHGAGSNAANTTIDIEPKSLRVTGGQAVLEEFGDTYLLGTLNLADLDRTIQELTYTISLPEGITNQTGTTEAKVTVRFTDLKTREFTIGAVHAVNIPQGMTVDIISTSLTVKVRGPKEQIEALTAEDIVATVDFSGAEAGTATYRTSFAFPEEFSDVGALKTVTVSATVAQEE